MPNYLNKSNLDRKIQQNKAEKDRSNHSFKLSDEIRQNFEALKRSPNLFGKSQNASAYSFLFLALIISSNVIEVGDFVQEAQPESFSNEKTDSKKELSSLLQASDLLKIAHEMDAKKISENQPNALEIVKNVITYEPVNVINSLLKHASNILNSAHQATKFPEVKALEINSEIADSRSFFDEFIVPKIDLYAKDSDGQIKQIIDENLYKKAVKFLFDDFKNIVSDQGLQSAKDSMSRVRRFSLALMSTKNLKKKNIFLESNDEVDENLEDCLSEVLSGSSQALYNGYGDIAISIYTDKEGDFLPNNIGTLSHELCHMDQIQKMKIPDVKSLQKCSSNLSEYSSGIFGLILFKDASREKGVKKYFSKEWKAPQKFSSKDGIKYADDLCKIIEKNNNNKIKITKVKNGKKNQVHYKLSKVDGDNATPRQQELFNIVFRITLFYDLFNSRYGTQLADEKIGNDIKDLYKKDFFSKNVSPNKRNAFTLLIESEAYLRSVFPSHFVDNFICKDLEKSRPINNLDSEKNKNFIENIDKLLKDHKILPSTKDFLKKHGIFSSREAIATESIGTDPSNSVQPSESHKTLKKQTARSDL